MPSFVRFGQLLNPVKKTYFKIPFSQNSKSFVWKPNFFRSPAIQKLLFALHFHYTGDTPCRVWLDLDTSLTRWQRPIFKIPFSQNSKSSLWNSNFFAGQAIPQLLFALHCHYTVDTQYRVWFHLDNSLTRWKRTIFKIRKSLQFAKIAKVRMKNHFFPMQAIQKLLSALHFHYTGDTPCRVSLDSDNSLTRWKRPILKFLFRKIQKVSYENPTFFLVQLYKNYFLLYTSITLVILHAAFG